MVFFNNSFYGPLYPFKIVFEKMSKVDVDFWGLSCHDEAPDASKKGKFGYWPQHIQSFFLVVRKHMHTSYEFKNYWETMQVANSYNDVISSHETIFTETFANAGYSWTVYSDTREEKTSRNTSWCHYAFALTDMIKNRNYPIIKKRPLTMEKWNMLPFNNGDDMNQAMAYVKKHTSYNTNLIWENLLRTDNLYDIINGLNLIYTLSSDFSPEGISACKNMAALFLCISQSECDYWLKEMIQKAAQYIDIYILCNSKKNENYFTNTLPVNCRIKFLQKKHITIGSLLTEFCKEINSYKYIAVGHDSQIDPIKEVSSEKLAFQHYAFDALFATKHYVENVIKQFENEEKLGFLSIEPPLIGRHFSKNYSCWDDTLFNLFKALGKKLEINLNITPEKPPVTTESFFWIRTCIIQKLIDSVKTKNLSAKIKLNENDEIAMFIPYFAQSYGYYSGRVMTERQSSSLNIITKYILKNTFQTLEKKEKTHWNYYHEFWIQQNSK